MKSSVIVTLVTATAVSALSGQATTTRYYDGQEGACGCGTSSGLYSWQTGISSDVYTAAGSDALFGSGSTWCGSGCGTCYNLTSTGSVPSSCSSCGDGGASGESITVMITNLCPNNGNAEWCPVAGSTNSYGYSYHFDIMASSSALGEILGDNPVVDFEEVTCPSAATTDYDQCVCAT